MIGFASDRVANCGILMELMEANLNDVMHKPAFSQYQSWEGSYLSVASDTSLGMSCLHQQGVLHCDLKPANILISAQWVAKARARVPIEPLFESKPHNQRSSGSSCVLI